VQWAARQVNSTVTSSSRIDFEAVRRAMIQIDETRPDTTLNSNTLYLRVIKPHVKESRSRYFLAEARPGRFTAAMNDLLSKGAIHKIPARYVHPSISDEYECFEIRYARYIDLMRAAEYQTGEKIDSSYDHEELASITASTKHRYVLDFTPLASANASDVVPLLCDSCDKQFMSDEPAYVVRHMCPHCFMDQ
jgi:hypothetical protein